jgi:hypothetical protein
MEILAVPRLRSVGLHARSPQRSPLAARLPVRSGLTLLRTTVAQADQYLQAEITLGVGGTVAAAAVHPRQDAQIEVLRGAIRLQRRGRAVGRGVGAAVVLPAGSAHVGWNDGPDDAVVRVTFEPVREGPDRSRADVGRAGETPGLGVLRQAALLAQTRDLCLAVPPAMVPGVLFAVGAPFVRMLGYGVRAVRYSPPLASEAA